MKTLHINFELWSGDNLYYIKDSTINQTIVNSLHHSFKTNIKEETVSYTEYILDTGDRIFESDLGQKYFIDKKELIQKLVA